MNKKNMNFKSMHHKIRMVIIMLSLVYMQAIPQIASAKTIKDSILVKGTEKLITDVSGALMVVAPAIGGVMYAFQYFKSTHAEEEELRVIKKKQKSIAIGVIGVFVASTIISIVATYYKSATV